MDLDGLLLIEEVQVTGDNRHWGSFLSRGKRQSNKVGFGASSDLSASILVKVNLSSGLRRM